MGMENFMGSLFPKHHWASQQTFDGELIVNSTPMPSYALTSIYLPIIPILLSLF